ncbi:CoA ester lyase [Streptomyces sp. NPDC005438]|uniref:HpcH/HpaI aldolase/citrate lyase family protein n=1 Tax=Streptomyces sp. NPDC005438 TaxID=3156880 RepID=UPI0033A89BC0
MSGVVPSPVRSALYVPGDRPEMLARAEQRGADALILDLEDAVAPARKEVARATVVDWLAGLTHRPRPRVWVRVNPGAAGTADLAALAGLPWDGVLLAKAESARQVTEAYHLLGRGSHGPPPVLCPVLESPSAVAAAEEIARAPGVARLHLGEADLCAELGVDPGPEGLELLWIRSRLVLVCAAAGLAPPLAPAFTDLADPERLRATTRRFARLGFRGRTCVHPAQVPVVNEVFTPDAEEVAEARALVRRFEEAGSGVLVDDRGRMVDEAVVRRARAVLRTAEVAGFSPEDHPVAPAHP